MDFSGFKKSILASCWVMVLPPCTMLPALMSCNQSTEYPDKIDPRMAVKTDVLDSDEGLFYVVRYLVVGYEGPSFIVELGKDFAVSRIYL